MRVRNGKRDRTEWKRNGFRILLGFFGLLSVHSLNSSSRSVSVPFGSLRSSLYTEPEAFLRR